MPWLCLMESGLSMTLILKSVFSSLYCWNCHYLIQLAVDTCRRSKISELLAAKNCWQRLQSSRARFGFGRPARPSPLLGSLLAWGLCVRPMPPRNHQAVPRRHRIGIGNVKRQFVLQQHPAAGLQRAEPTARLAPPIACRHCSGSRGPAGC